MANIYTSVELQGLELLREKLVARRRSIISKLADAHADSFSGETFSKIQGAIDAVDHAIADEHGFAMGAQPRPRIGADGLRAQVGTA